VAGARNGAMTKRVQKARGGVKRNIRSKPPVPVPCSPERELVMERYGPMRQMDRSFDIEYWQRQGDAAIFQAAWELVESYWREAGKNPDALRLQRSVEAFKKL
jgi:hypothetical protein